MENGEDRSGTVQALTKLEELSVKYASSEIFTVPALPSQQGSVSIPSDSMHLPICNYNSNILNKPNEFQLASFYRRENKSL